MMILKHPKAKKKKKKAKVSYSDRGEGIDCYVPADGTLGSKCLLCTQRVTIPFIPPRLYC